MVTCEIEPGDWICIKDGWFQVRRVERDYSLSDSAGSGFYEELIYFKKNPDRYGVTRRKFVTGVLSDEAMLQNIKQILVSAEENSAVGIIKRICRGLVSVCDHECYTFGYDAEYELAKRLKGESS